jgi:hypothetical protein
MTGAEGRERLGPVDKAWLVWLVLRAYPAAWRQVRRNDLRAMVEHARSTRAMHECPSPDPERSATLLAAATRRTVRLLPSDKRCLVTSLVLLRLLEQHGLKATLVLGVRQQPEFLAHAWVERDGKALLPSHGFPRLSQL